MFSRKDRDIISPQPASSQEYYPASTGSSDALDLARSWLDDCLERHDGCNQMSLGANGKLPTRLIEISEVDGQLVPRLVITPASAGLADIQYCTLSHVWAATVRGPGKTIQLLPDNIERLQQCIPIGELPQTFQDAMKITRRLGYQYIWIDSLCIIQDPSDTTVFQKEAVTMCDVYSNTSCNIAALGLGNDSMLPVDTYSPVDFCFTTRNPLEYVPCRIATPNENEAIYVSLEQYRRLPDSLRNSPLLSRAWVFQERFLSPRILYFGTEQLYWECRCHTKSESRPVDDKLLFQHYDTSRAQFLELCDFPHNRDRYSTSIFKSTSDSASEKRTNDGFNIGSVIGKVPSVETINTVGLMLSWYRVIEDYTETSLTYASDRFIALAGIVKAIGNCVGLTYVAGTWMEFWPFDLLWVWRRDVPMSKRTACGTHLPSWSWASAEGRKEFRGLHLDGGKLGVPTSTLMQVVKLSFPALEEHHYHNVNVEDTPWEGFGMTITVHAFTKSGKVTGPVKHPLTKQRRHGIKFGNNHHDYLNIWWDGEPTEGDSVLVVPLVRWEVPPDPLRRSEEVWTLGLILMQDKSSHSENDGRRYRRVGIFDENSYNNAIEFMLFSELFDVYERVTLFSGEFDVREREEICLC